MVQAEVASFVSNICASTWPADAPPGISVKLPFNDPGWQRLGPPAVVEGAEVELLVTALPGPSVEPVAPVVELVTEAPRFGGEEVHATTSTPARATPNTATKVRRMTTNLSAGGAP